MAKRRSVDRGLLSLRQRKYSLQGQGRGGAKAGRFIPDGDSDFARMARFFTNHVLNNAERFSIPHEKAHALNASVREFRDALARTLDKNTKGPRATLMKNDARKEAQKIVRAVARMLRGCESVTNTDRILLDMSERPKRLKARKCPQIAPLLQFVGTTHGQVPRHILEYKNDFDRASSAKPRGASRLELFVELVPVGLPVPMHPGEISGGRLWYVQSYTTSRFEVEFPVFSDGTPMLVCYWGRWADARGRVGPFSATCVTRMEGGSLPKLMYFGGMQPKLESAKVCRTVEPRQLGAASVPHEGWLEQVIADDRLLLASSNLSGVNDQGEVRLQLEAGQMNPRDRNVIFDTVNRPALPSQSG